MNKFNWYEAASIEDALNQVNTNLAEEIYAPTNDAVLMKAGGVDILDMIKEGMISPKTLVNIRNIPGLDKIELGSNGDLVIGANATLAEIAEHKNVKEHYNALYQAIAHAATPQLRNMATIGGNLAQRTRCWYFRSADHPCFRKGGDRCFARSSKTGENENHAIFDNSSCVSVHASSISTALMAYEAKVVIWNSKKERKEIPIEEFFVSPAEDVSKESILGIDELISEIIVPRPDSNTKSCYIKQGVRESYDWSIGDVAIVAKMKAKTVEKAIVVLGAVAPVPWRSFEAEKALNGKTLNESLAAQAAEKALEKSNPLTKNNYKVPLLKSIIKQALLELT